MMAVATVRAVALVAVQYLFLCCCFCLYSPALFAANSAVRFDFSTPPEGQIAAEAMGALVELSGEAQHTDTELQITNASLHVAITLVNASSAMMHQAFAHALGCWWARSANGHEILYSKNQHLPQGTLSVRWATSGLCDRPGLEHVVNSLMIPWLGGNAGVSYSIPDGLWPATLDPAGHAHLVAILTALERQEPQCPDLIADPDALDLERRFESTVRGDTWGQLTQRLSRNAHISIALGPSVPATSIAHDMDIPPSALSALPEYFLTHGMQAAFIHGVLCIDAAVSDEREHPGLRARLAIVPIPHLAHTTVDGEFITTSLRTWINPTWWAQPGAGLLFMPEHASLLIAADSSTIHAVLDALDGLDRLGVEAGLAVLAAKFHAP